MLSPDRLHRLLFTEFIFKHLRYHPLRPTHLIQRAPVTCWFAYNCVYPPRSMHHASSCHNNQHASVLWWSSASATAPRKSVLPVSLGSTWGTPYCLATSNHPVEVFSVALPRSSKASHFLAWMTHVTSRGHAHLHTSGSRHASPGKLKRG